MAADVPALEARAVQLTQQLQSEEKVRTGCPLCMADPHRQLHPARGEQAQAREGCVTG